MRVNNLTLPPFLRSAVAPIVPSIVGIAPSVSTRFVRPCVILVKTFKKSVALSVSKNLLKNSCPLVFKFCKEPERLFTLFSPVC